MKRFWDKVSIKGENDCWEWQAGKDSHGYGRFRYNKKQVGTHRVSYELTNGEIQENMSVCHRCDNPGCVNPNHLFLGTQKENMQDMRKKGRGFTPTGERNHSAKLRNVDVNNIRAIYKYTKATQKKLADIYSVDVSTIRSVVNRYSWKHF